MVGTTSPNKNLRLASGVLKSFVAFVAAAVDENPRLRPADRSAIAFIPEEAEAPVPTFLEGSESFKPGRFC